MKTSFINHLQLRSSDLLSRQRPKPVQLFSSCCFSLASYLSGNMQVGYLCCYHGDGAYYGLQVSSVEPKRNKLQTVK